MMMVMVEDGDYWMQMLLPLVLTIGELIRPTDGKQLAHSHSSRMRANGIDGYCHRMVISSCWYRLLTGEMDWIGLSESENESENRDEDE